VIWQAVGPHAVTVLDLAKLPRASGGRPRPSDQRGSARDPLRASKVRR